MQNATVNAGKRHYEAPRVISAKHLQLEKVARHARQIEFVLAKPFNEEETIRIFVDYLIKHGPWSHEFYAAKKRLYAQNRETQKKVIARTAELLRAAGVSEQEIGNLMFMCRKGAVTYQPITELPEDVLREMWMINWVPQGDELHARVCQKALEEDVLAHGAKNRSIHAESIINIMLEGRLHSEYRCLASGRLLPGNGSGSAEPHGPPYVILENSVNQNAPDRGYQIGEEYHLAYLVRDELQKASIRKAMDCGLGLGLLTPNEHVLVLLKLITYEEFLAAPAGAFESVEAFHQLVIERRA
jgi:hypothetical protein